MSVPAPVPGPAVQWISGADVAAFNPGAVSSVGSNVHLLDDVAVDASFVLFEVSGRQFPGLQVRKVRPSLDLCSCWGPSSLGLGPWYWMSAPFGAGGWGWWNEMGSNRRGCSPLQQVRLAGYPVREVTEVKIDGVVLPQVDPVTAIPNWRLDRWRFLTRMAKPVPYQQNYWPSCQNLDVDDTQPGSFSVTYEWGIDPPQLGKDAACELAAQLWIAAGGAAAQTSVLPPGVSRVTRQGVTVERGVLANWFDPQKPTGLVHLDSFLKAVWPNRGQRRPAFFSPDLQRYAHDVG